LARGFDRLAATHAELALNGVEDAAYIAHLARRVLAILEYRRSAGVSEHDSRLKQLRHEAELAGLESGVGFIDRVLSAT
jgi:hypothetical protein